MKIKDFLAKPLPPTLWVCEGILCAGGITMLHGKTSVGKSPFTWEIARATSLGQDAFGLYPTVKSRVLYIEADSPDVQIQPRLLKMESDPGEWDLKCIQGQGIDIALPTAKGTAMLKSFQTELDPQVVIWNTLRALTVADLSKGETVSRTYYNLRAFFPSAAHLIVHHDRKESTADDTHEIPDEAFSGSAGWRDTAQVAIRLWSGGDKHKKYKMFRRTKSQVCAEMEKPQKLILRHDATNWDLYESPTLTKVRTILGEPIPIGYKSEVEYIMYKLNLSQSQTYALIDEAKG